MALLGNYTVRSKHPGRDIGGGATGLGMFRGDFSKASQARGRFGLDTWEPKSGVPEGCRPPYTWILPITAGGLATRNLLLGTGALTASGAMGVNGTAALTGSGTLTADGQLIVSAVAALTGTGTISDADARAFLNAAADLIGTGTITTANANALAETVAALTGTGSLTMDGYAVGTLEADITPFTDLSPENLASAVWAASTAGFDNDTFGAAVQFLHALAHNKIITDPSAGTFTVYDTDGTTVLYQADLFEDAAGTTPYSGSGSERRDAFA